MSLNSLKTNKILINSLQCFLPSYHEMLLLISAKATGDTTWSQLKSTAVSIFVYTTITYCAALVQITSSFKQLKVHTHTHTKIKAYK